MNLLDRLVAIWRRENPEEHLPRPVAGIDRRRFLTILGSSAAVAAAAPMLDLEQLVWTPRQALVVPELGGGILLTTEWITREALKILEKNLKMVTSIERVYDDQFDVAGARAGQTLHILMHPTVEFQARPGHDTVNDWRRRILPEITQNARMADDPLPIDAFVNKVCLATEGQTKAYGVLRNDRMTVKLT